jgi:hypothetical protein
MPGPWRVDADNREGYEWNNHIVSATKPHMTICFMAHTKREDGNETGEANARLIAAAPELYRLLTYLMEHSNARALLSEGFKQDAERVLTAVDGGTEP